MPGSTAPLMAAVCTAFVLIGCESAPEPSPTPAPASQPTPAVALREIVAVPILDAVTAELGGPERYTLALIQSEARLPIAVVEAGLEVDFDTQAVVFVGMGQRPTLGHGVEITGLQRVGETLYVQAVFTQPAADTWSGQALTAPWAAVTIARPGPVTLRSDFRDAR